MASHHHHFPKLMTFRDDGHGSPVIALHASASTSRQWDSLTGYLSGRFRVIRPDLPGYGASATFDCGNRLQDIAGALSGLLQRLGEPVHLVGHSFGGAVALRTTLMMPGAIRSLTVIEPAAFHLLHRHPRDRTHLATIGAVEAAMRGHLMAADAHGAMAGFIDFWNGDGAWMRTSEDLRQKLAVLAPQVMRDFAAIFADDTTFGDYGRITCPVLAIRGSNSPPAARHLTRRLASAMPDARLAEIAGAGHMAPLTDPHEVDPLIAAHIMRAESVLGNLPGSLPLAA